MDGIVPPTSTRQPFGLYAATSASLAPQDYNFAEHLPNGRNKTCDLFYVRFTGGITADRTARKNISRYTSLRSLRAAPSPKMYNVIPSSRTIYRWLFELTCPTIFTWNSSARLFWSFFTVQTGDDRSTHTPINGMQIKASEQIKSAKSQNRKSRRKFSQIAAKTVLRRSGKINFPEFNLAKNNRGSRSKFVSYFGSTS